MLLIIFGETLENRNPERTAMKENFYFGVRASQLLGIHLEAHMGLWNLRSSQKHEFHILRRKFL